MDELIFLGTGGGRFTTLFQSRATGGLIFNTSGHQIHIDPGPGALLRCRECKVYPFKTDILMATHSHIDHVNDLNMMIEGVTNAATRKRGVLVTVKEVMDEIVTDYHKNLLKEIIIVKSGMEVKINNLRVLAVKCSHLKSECVGFKFYTNNYCLYYTGDTSVYPGFEKNFEDVDFLIANVMRPDNNQLPHHMCTDDLISVLKNSEHEIKLVIINHFGTIMLRAGAENEAARIMKETGVKTIAAADSLIVKLNDNLLKK
ncbi:hypothetical protein COX58_00515 [archaeon CG_4_10_14_0_2_um_filter_Archaea_38_6]|nr:MAG: hypothetical protein COS83_04620 [archaeon CG07_land_8_20_14_0_80_38_8]PIU88688.1 MAG: hypothetical protein COS64_02945 [archaeon CG06_land_8_20_14_3_00_37_11]PJA23052.1 MAG: hypothetical protein COX58_00515 [archaeon CG_4_10_14_0_2_um_filter_Archaea_38_6]